jgi:hypothetical protein
LEIMMTIRTTPQRETPSAKVRFIAEIFRTLALFRKDYDERLLQELAATLRRRMSDEEADRIMSDALVMDNEIRFRLPAGLALEKVGATSVSADERALAALIVDADDPEGAATAAEVLGIAQHRVLRQCASLLAGSLRRAGIETEWGATPATVQMVSGRPYVDMRS